MKSSHALDGGHIIELYAAHACVCVGKTIGLDFGESSIVAWATECSAYNSGVRCICRKLCSLARPAHTQIELSVLQVNGATRSL